MLTRRGALLGLGILGVPAAVWAAPAPRYHFAVVGVEGEDAVGAKVAAAALAQLGDELSRRPQFTSTLEADPRDEAAVVAELRRRKLQGFRVTLRIDRVKKDLLPPSPGGRLKRLMVDLKLSVFGTTIPGETLAFGGEGEATMEAEVAERRVEEETAALLVDVLNLAIKQAVDQAVLKLSTPKSEPGGASKPRRKRKAT